MPSIISQPAVNSINSIYENIDFHVHQETDFYPSGNPMIAGAYKPKPIVEGVVSIAENPVASLRLTDPYYIRFEDSKYHFLISGVLKSIAKYPIPNLENFSINNYNNKPCYVVFFSYKYDSNRIVVKNNDDVQSNIFLAFNSIVPDAFQTLEQYLQSKKVNESDSYYLFSSQEKYKYATWQKGILPIYSKASTADNIVLYYKTNGSIVYSTKTSTINLLADTFYHIPYGPDSLKSVFTDVDFNKVQEYYITINNQSTVLLQSPSVLIENCKNAQIFYYNKLGALDSIPIDIKQIDHGLSYGVYESTFSDKQKHIENRLNIKSNNTYEFSISLLENNIDWVEDLIDTPSAWLQQRGSGLMIPIVLETDAYSKLKRESRYDYRINIVFRKANKNKTLYS